MESEIDEINKNLEVLTEQIHDIESQYQKLSWDEKLDPHRLSQLGTLYLEVYEIIKAYDALV